MMKSVPAFLIALLAWTAAAFAQNPSTSANPGSQNKTKNVWAGDNFEQVCPITATGSPGTFTPTCPSNNITITASGQTIALPTVGTPPGFQPGQVTKSVELNIFYAAPYAPVFASGYTFPNGATPILCAAGASGCLSGVVSSSPDIVECRTASEILLRCGNPLTSVGPPPVYAVVAGNHCKSAGGGADCTTTATNMAPTGSPPANLLLACMSYYNGTATATPIDSQGNSYTPIYSAVIPSSNNVAALYYSRTTNVTSSMTFSTSSTAANSTFPGMAVMGFSGASASPLDQSTGTPANNSSSSNTSLQPGTITPGSANELLGTCLSLVTDSTGKTIASPFAIGANADTNTTTGYGAALAFQIQSGAPAAQNPTWSWSAGSESSAGQASFH